MFENEAKSETKLMKIVINQKSNYKCTQYEHVKVEIRGYAKWEQESS